jgi:hypothetical protein
VIGSTLAAQAPPAEIKLAEQMAGTMSAEDMLAQKAQANTARTAMPLLWLIPVSLFVIAIALVVRSVPDLITWVQWPLFVVGLLGLIAALRIGNPAPMIRNALLPIPEAVAPAPAVAVILRLADGLFSQVSTAMLWQTVPLLVIGLGLLVYSYQDAFKAIPAGLRNLFHALTPPALEEKA